MVDEHCVVISEVLTQFLSRITVSLYFAREYSIFFYIFYVVCQQLTKEK